MLFVLFFLFICISSSGIKAAAIRKGTSIKITNDNGELRSILKRETENEDSVKKRLRSVKNNHNDSHQKQDSSQPLIDDENESLSDNNTSEHMFNMCVCVVKTEYSDYCAEYCRGSTNVLQENSREQAHEINTEKDMDPCLNCKFPQHRTTKNCELCLRGPVEHTQTKVEHLTTKSTTHFHNAVSTESLNSNSQEEVTTYVKTPDNEMKNILGDSILLLIVPVILLLIIVIFRKAKHLYQRQHYIRANYLIDGIIATTPSGFVLRLRRKADDEVVTIPRNCLFLKTFASESVLLRNET